MLARLHGSGSFWIVISCFSFSTMGVFVKLGSRSFTTAELMFYRASIALAIMLAIILSQRKTLRVPAPVLGMHFWRSLCGAISMMAATYAMAHLPLPTAVTLQNTAPLFLMLLIAIVHRSLPQRMQAFSIALGFVGVVLLLRPMLSRDSWFAATMAVMSGLFTAGSMFNIRKLGLHGEPEWRTVFYFLLTSAVFSGIWMLLQPDEMAALDLENIGIILAMGIFLSAGQFTMTRAYGCGKSLVVACLSYLTVAFTAVYGMLIWHDRLPLTSYGAMLLIAGSGMLTAFRSR